eukprot:GHVS01034710.1.p1 GENE.GHVS01034710.1~~GHVS01034710.1.p1  ORF type:complete len:1006 (-),score=143.50 GHVS01034710.1:269-3286(-)
MSAVLTMNPTTPPAPTSAASVLCLLEEAERPLQVAALQRLNRLVDLHWPEIADSIAEIEKLYEDELFSHRELASLVASKVYYHLEDYREALRYALGANELFDITERSEYVETVVAKCIDEYVRKRHEWYERQQKSGEEVEIDPKLEKVVEKMLDVCRTEGEEKQALGIAFDARRLDKVEEIINGSSNLSDILQHCLKNAQSLISSKRFRSEVVALLVKIYEQLPEDKLVYEYPHLCQCLFYQGNSNAVATILAKLLKDNDLIAHQIAFDLVDLESQSFLKELLSHNALELPPPPPKQEDKPVSPDDEAKSEKKADGGEEEPLISPEPLVKSEDDADMKEEKGAEEPEENAAQRKLEQLRYILSGKASIELQLQFLHRSNKADLILLDDIKNSVDQRNSIIHHGVVIAHGLMQAGTTSSAFLRPNLEWFGKAVNWAKFSAAASLGVIHKGHIKESKVVLGSYLPRVGGERGSPFSEGGALYALGLINANHSDESVKEYLLAQLRGANNDETLQHGACLGLGLLCMSQNDDSLYDELKGVMFMDSAVAGEAAAYAIGILMLGTASEKATSDLLGYAHDTQHEKIIRACAVAMGMVMYRREEEADALIDQLSLDKDVLIRYGAMYCIGLAYCGTSKNSAVRRLLHVSVSDVSDDVRRAAVIALGFVLCSSPEQVPKILNLLAESYNPHVRYAAALAIGISCAGSAMSEAIGLLMPMTTDTTEFVRQGAMIGLGLVLQQTSEAVTSDVKKVRETIMKALSDKHEDVMTRFGAILAAGLIDAGGRNTAASFFSKTGNLRQEAAVGFCLFTQLWYWFPFIHCISLALQATSLIGLDKDLQMPSNFEIVCAARPEMFAYPAPTNKEKKEEKKETMHAVLSTTAKRQALKAKKQQEQKSAVVSVEPTNDEAPEGTESNSSATKVEEDKKCVTRSMQSKKEEILKNPCRVVPQQESFIEFPETGRYVPVFPNRRSGFIMLRDTRPDEVGEFVETKRAVMEKKEPDAPESFEWSG